MSVINQVLVELEKRRASGVERGAIPDHVRALPEGESDHHAWWFAAAGGAGLAIAALAWVLMSGFGWPAREQGTTTAVPAAHPAVASMSAAAAIADLVPRRDSTGESTVAAPSSAGRMSLELSAVPAQRPNEMQARPAAVREPVPAARVLARADSAAAASAPEGENRTPVPAAPAAVSPPPRPAAEPAKPHAAPVAEKPALSGKPGIEKQVRQPTGRELADNEYRKAATSLHQGRAHEALEGFRTALGLYPGHHGARQALVALLVESKANAEAERLLQEGIKLAPEQIGFAMTLARLQVDRGDGAGAIATLQGSLTHAQASPDYAAFLAALLQRQGRHEQAIEQFQVALKAKPGTGVWWLGLAISLQALNRAPDAQDAYRRAKTSNNLNAELTAFADQRLRQLQ